MVAVSIIGFPLLAFFVLLMGSSIMSKRAISVLGVLGVVLSCIATVTVWLTTHGLPQQLPLWTFLPASILGTSSVSFGLLIDSLSLTMALVVSFVSSLIAIYSTEYMAHEDGFGRFFAGINLFVAFMLMLVLADSLWLLFIGWEGVGLASYLLIGFFYREQKAVVAAMKAFLTTRVGDVFLLFGMFVCFKLFSTLDMMSIATIAKSSESSTLVTIAALCFLGGAVGKSAQLPLQTWLADAMWGPTPVSALIHAATMVTAGVYLLVRMSCLVVLSPTAQLVIMVVGLLTLILAGCAALYQTDMKRVLAYSTMSQIGYMFLAVGALAFQAAMFHLVTHAFFKALLFLSAGVIGHALHSYDLFAMGGLKKSLTKVYACFIIGGTSLMGLPLVSAGFFSKEWILNDLLAHPHYGTMLFFAASVGTLLTALYTCRMIALAFLGNKKTPVHDHAGLPMYGTLFVLALFSLGIGWLQSPHFLGEIHIMADFLTPSVPRSVASDSGFMWLIPTGLAIFGAFIALQRYAGGARMTAPTPWSQFMKQGFGFDWLYSTIFVKPFNSLSSLLQPDFIKTLYEQFVASLQSFFEQIAKMHTGRLSQYLSFMIVAVVTLASIMVLS